MILRLFNDARAINKTGYGAELGISDMGRAFHDVRRVWATHRAIVGLPSWTVEAAEGVDESVRAAIEDRMAHFIFDLGNSSEDAWWGARNAIANSAMACQEPKHDALFQRAAGRAVICVASGPTAADHIKAIGLAQWRGAVVVCADSIYKPLLAAGIEPDIVCVLERTPVMAGLVPTPSQESKTLLVCPPVVDRSVPEQWHGRRVWFWQDHTSLYPWIGPDVPMAASGRSAGTMAVAVSLMLGGTATYLVGHDLCNVGERTHAACITGLTVDGLVKAEQEAQKSPGSFFVRTPVFNRKGEQTTCTRFWSMCRHDIEQMLTGFSNVYAVDMRGTDIAGTIPLERLPDFPYQSGSARGTMPITPSKNMTGIKERIAEDIAAFDALSVTATGVEACRALEPQHWASKETLGLHLAVLGTIYNAASLRVHLRSREDKCADLSLRILKRGITASLRMMERDVC